jgi:hypothetical protein
MKHFFSREELCNLPSSPRTTSHVAHVERKKKYVYDFGGKVKRKESSMKTPK